MQSSLWGVYLGLDLLSHKVGLCLASLRTVKKVFQTTMPVFTPNSNSGKHNCDFHLPFSDEHWY